MTTTTTGIATEFIQFSRTSNATLTDSDGKIKWAPHNLILASEQFDTSNWTKTDVTITANAVVAPNGTTTADALLETATTATHRTSQFVSAISGATYRIGLFVKPLGRNWSVLQISTGATDAYAFFNITTGVVGTTGTGAINPTISRDATTGWCYISLSVVATATSVQYVVEPRVTDGGTTYLGDITKGIYLWGAHLYRNDLGGMKSNTSAYPLYNPTTAKNLVGFTEDLSNAYWVKTNILAFGSGSVGNATIAPNGLSTADLVVSSTVLGFHYFDAPTSLMSANGNYTISIYAKAAGYNFCGVGNGFGTRQAIFDLITGSVSSVTASTTASISSAGDGWWRCSISFTPTGASDKPQISVSDSSSGVQYTGDGTSGIYFWGAQLSDSASLDPYVPNFGAAPTAAAYYGPRIDYDATNLGTAKGLLIEEQRTNLAQYSDAFNDAYWARTGVPTVTANTFISPSGEQTADTITGSGSVFAGVYKHITSTNAATYTSSVYVKSGTSPFVVILVNAGSGGAWFNLTTGAKGSTSGTVAAYDIFPVGNGWYRVWVSAVANGTTNATIWIAPASADTVTSGTGSVYAWGAQVELGSFATSYIPTAASTVTRSADVPSVGTGQFPYNSTEGTIVVNVSTFDTTSNLPTHVNLSDGTTSNYIRVNASPTAYKLRNFVRSGGVDVVNATSGGATVANEPFKVGVYYKANSFNSSVNGAISTEVTTGAVPSAATTLSLGNWFTSAGTFLNGHIRQITYTPRRITNAELQQKTSA